MLLHPLTTMLRSRTRDIHLADDLGHEALLLLLVRLRRGAIRDPSRLAGFLYRTACNLVIIHRRRAARDQRVELFDRADPAASPLAAAVHSEERQLLQRSIAALVCARDREILRRFYLDEEEKSAVQASLALSSAHFDRVLHRARERLRRTVGELTAARGERNGRARAVPRTRARAEAIKNKFRR